MRKGVRKQRIKSCHGLIVMVVFDLGIKCVKKVGGSVKIYKNKLRSRRTKCSLSKQLKR